MNKKEEKKTIADAVNEEQPEQKDKVKSKDDKPEFTSEQQEWINKFVAGIKSESKHEMEDYKKQVDSTISDQVQAQLAEQERRAKMSAEEKAADDRKKLEQENNRLQAELNQRKLVDYGRSIAPQFNIPSSMIARLIGASDAETEQNMKAFAQDYQEALQAGIEKKLASTSQPQTGATANVDTTKKFEDLSLDEQTKLYREDPNLYNQLANR